MSSRRAWDREQPRERLLRGGPGPRPEEGGAEGRWAWPPRAVSSVDWLPGEGDGTPPRGALWEL